MKVQFVVVFFTFVNLCVRPVLYLKGFKGKTGEIIDNLCLIHELKPVPIDFANSLFLKLILSTTDWYRN